MPGRKSSNLSDVRKNNCKFIFEILKKSDGMTLLELEQNTGLSRPTTIGMVRVLEEAGLVTKIGRGDSNGGRIPVIYGINPDAYYAIGIDFEYPVSRVAISDMKGIIRFSSRRKYKRELTAKEAIEQLLLQINELIHESKIERDKFLGLGLGMPGYINLKTGVSLYFERISEWKNVEIEKILFEGTGIPVYMENDVHLLYRAERTLIPLKDAQQDTLFIAIRSGIGMAIFQRGHLVEGMFGNAGHIGHSVVQADGPQCKCGNYGCLELYSSEEAILRKYELLTEEKEDSVTDIVRKAEEGHPEATAVLMEAGRYLGIGIGNVVNLFDINKIIIASCFDNRMILEYAQKELDRRVNIPQKRDVQLCSSQLTEENFALGGCKLVFRRGQQQILSQVQLKNM